MNNDLSTPAEKKERILCAAIWYGDKKELVHGPYGVSNGFVLCGHRHHQIIELMFELTGRKTGETGCCQGFLTNENRFVSREAAAVIAFAAKQIAHKKSVLYSEDLY